MDPVLPPPAIEPDEDLPADAAADQVQVHILCLRERAQRLRAAHIALRTTPLTLETGNTPAPKPVRHPPASHPRARRAAHHNSTAATGQGSTAEQVSNPLLSAEQVSNQLPSTPPPVLPARQHEDHPAAAAHTADPPASHVAPFSPHTAPPPTITADLRGHAITMLRARWQRITEAAIRDTVRGIHDYQRAFGADATREFVAEYPAAPAPPPASPARRPLRPP